jgi:hypothetical protein
LGFPRKLGICGSLGSAAGLCDQADPWRQPVRGLNLPDSPAVYCWRCGSRALPARLILYRGVLPISGPNSTGSTSQIARNGTTKTPKANRKHALRESRYIDKIATYNCLRSPIWSSAIAAKNASQRLWPIAWRPPKRHARLRRYVPLKSQRNDAADTCRANVGA